MKNRWIGSESEFAYNSIFLHSCNFVYIVNESIGVYVIRIEYKKISLVPTVNSNVQLITDIWISTNSIQMDLKRNLWKNPVYFLCLLPKMQ